MPPDPVLPHGPGAEQAEMADTLLRPFKYRSPCTKCGYEHNVLEPLAEYDKDVNILIRTCRHCGFQWKEMCADGTGPLPRPRVELEPESKLGWTPSDDLPF